MERGDPIRIAEWILQGFVALNLISKNRIERFSDGLNPVPRFGYGPVRQVQILGFSGFCAGPQPVIRRATKIRVHRVSFDVVGDSIKGPVTLDWIGPKPILINSPATDGRCISAKSNGVGGAEPMKPLNDARAGVSLNQKVIVVWHDAKGEEP